MLQIQKALLDLIAPIAAKQKSSGVRIAGK